MRARPAHRAGPTHSAAAAATHSAAGAASRMVLEATARARSGAARRSRPAGRNERTVPPLYARVLRLRHIHPSAMLCFLFFEGALAVAAVLALTELVSWWTLLILPAAVAAMVKLNDLIAGASGYPEARPPAGRAVRW